MDNGPNVFRYESLVASADHNLPNGGVHLASVVPWPFDNNISTKLLDRFQETFGSKGSFEKRKTCQIIGHNSYFGPRTRKTRVTFLQGPEENTHQLRKQGHDPSFKPALEAVTNNLTNQANFVMSLLCHSILQHYAEVIETDDVTGICKLKIYTDYSPDKTLSFANTSHVDNDQLSAEAAKVLDGKLKDHLLYEKHPDDGSDLPRATAIARYLQRFRTAVGHYGTPTMCAYRVLISPADGASEDNLVELVQYFILDGLSVCIRIRDAIGIMFFGSAYQHLTSVCVGIDASGKVRFKHASASRIMAWGAGKNNREKLNGANEKVRKKKSANEKVRKKKRTK